MLGNPQKREAIEIKNRICKIAASFTRQVVLGSLQVGVLDSVYSSFLLFATAPRNPALSTALQRPQPRRRLHERPTDHEDRYHSSKRHGKETEGIRDRHSKMAKEFKTEDIEAVLLDIGGLYLSCGAAAAARVVPPRRTGLDGVWDTGLTALGVYRRYCLLIFSPISNFAYRVPWWGFTGHNFLNYEAAITE